MTEYLGIAGNTLAYEVFGRGPLVVLAHGIGDSQHSYRFLAPALAGAGYRVANVDIRGCGDSSPGWDGCSRTDIAGDPVAVVRHLGGPAVLIGQSISGGAATIAAATAPDLINGVIELAPFTRVQPFDLGGLLRVKRFRSGYSQMAQVVVRGSLASWKKYLDVAYPVKPADWADPRAEGEKIIADLPGGLGELAVIEGAGHCPHVQTPDQVLALARPFLDKTLANA
jgi:pimeloyl-ACP methyl ester carboxylesterase